MSAAKVITKIGITKDKISSRGGIALFLRYIEEIGLYRVILNVLSTTSVIFGLKGLQLGDFLKQMFAFFIDGTDMTMSGFDRRKSDEGYSYLLSCPIDKLASQHQIKRFFSKLSIVKDSFFNCILHELFVWRLHISQPNIIILGADTMVLDNDDALKREGCEPTYKKKKGFQPLHICWGSFLVDVLFRKGSAHSNHGTDYTDRVIAIVKLIRKRYNAQVPIILCSDSGFADQKAFECFERLHIHYITTGKFYKDTKENISELPQENFQVLKKNNIEWKYIEFGSSLKSWKKFRRTIYTRLLRHSDGQCILEFSQTDNLIYTNIGNDVIADKRLAQAQGGSEGLFQAGHIVALSHARGADELIHRSIKELATKEQLPFKQFGMNRAYYFLLVITHFIFEAYKQDVAKEVISIGAYPNTFRRKLIDFAVKVTSRSRQVWMKVSKTVFETINLELLWERCTAPPYKLAV